MNCKEYRESLMDAGRGCDGAGALAHARECPDCARILRNESVLSAALFVFAKNQTLTPSTELGARLLAQLDPSPKRRIAAWRWAVLAFGGAAAAVTLMILLVRTPIPSTKAPSAAAAAPMPPTNTETRIAGLVKVAASVKAVARQKHTRKATPIERAPEGELPFIPVPYAAPLLPTERLEVVRVNLPANALASLGVPVIEAEPEMRLNADLVLGENGLARAVRLVRASSTQ